MSPLGPLPPPKKKARCCGADSDPSDLDLWGGGDAASDGGDAASDGGVSNVSRAVFMTRVSEFGMCVRGNSERYVSAASPPIEQKGK